MVFTIDEVASLLLETGFRKPVIQLTMVDIPDLRSALLDYHCMLKMKAAMHQYAEGLQQLKVLDLIKKIPLLTKQFFITAEKKITAGYYVLKSIHVHLSTRSCGVCIAINYTPLSMAYYAYDSTANF